MQVRLFPNQPDAVCLFCAPSAIDKREVNENFPPPWSLIRHAGFCGRPKERYFATPFFTEDHLKLGKVFFFLRKTI
jgi:hypothetical protein